MDILSKSTGCDRSSYPFISSAGERTLVSDAVDDMVMYVVPGEGMPFIVDANVVDDMLELSIYTSGMSLVATAHPGSHTIIGPSGDLRGFIVWNEEGCTVLKSTLIANDPQPWATLYIDPFVCVPHKSLSLSSLSINGEHVVEYSVDISVNKYSPVKIDKDGAISLYRDYSEEATGITGVIFKDSDGKVLCNGENAKDHVLITTDAESDIRVVTGDTITITEITNDNI